MSGRVSSPVYGNREAHKSDKTVRLLLKLRKLSILPSPPEPEPKPLFVEHDQSSPSSPFYTVPRVLAGWSCVPLRASEGGAQLREVLSCLSYRADMQLPWVIVYHRSKGSSAPP